VSFMWFGVRLFGIRVAILTTVLFTCSTSLLGALSHDYLTAAGLAWISLFLATTVEAGTSRHLVAWAVVSGVLLGMCLYTHLPTAFFVFAIPLFVVAFPHYPARERLGRFGIYLLGLIGGFAIISIVFGLYNRSLGGSFYYL